MTRLSLTLGEANALATERYAGASSPLSEPRPGHQPLDCEWWRQPRKVERFSSDRHRGALALYLALARSSLIPLSDGCFPSAFDFSDGKRRNPDKGFVKMCLNVEPPILTCRMMQGHLLFDVTEVGLALLESE